MGTNVEVSPSAKTPPKPPAGKRSINDIPAVNVHGHNPNFPGEPNNPGDTINVGQRPEAGHGWFHS